MKPTTLGNILCNMQVPCDIPLHRNTNCRSLQYKSIIVSRHLRQWARGGPSTVWWQSSLSRVRADAVVGGEVERSDGEPESDDRHGQ